MEAKKLSSRDFSLLEWFEEITWNERKKEMGEKGGKQRMHKKESKKKGSESVELEREMMYQLVAHSIALYVIN